MRDNDPLKELSPPIEKDNDTAATFTVAQAEAVAGRTVLLVGDVCNAEAVAEAAGVLLHAGAHDVRLLAAMKSFHD